MSEPYTLSVALHHIQRKCRMTLQIGGDSIPMSFDDAIEFKIEIMSVMGGSFPSARDIVGSFDPWKAKFLPFKGGLSIEIRQAARPMVTLALNAKQTEQFAAEIQKFIDGAGDRS